jgi:hypothetical protein
MATLSVKNPTLLDLAKVTDPDGSIAAVVEILNETNEVLADMSWMEGNLPTGHRTTVRTGIPTPTWRKLYGGVQPNKSSTVQVTDNTGMLEAYAEVDKALADLNGNTSAFRLQEDKPHIEGINQEIVDTLFYGNEATEPEAFTGLAPRFANLTADANSDNVIDGGGTGSDNASIWLVVWGPNTVHGIIPKGSTAGLKVSDLGEVTLEDASDGSNTGRMQAYRTHYRWDAGLTVRDWRYVVRIANIDKSALIRTYASGTFSTGAILPDLMFQAMRLVPNLSAGRAAFYCSRDIATWISRQTVAMANGSTITTDKVGGDSKFTEYFHGIPLRRVDSLAADEAALT